MMWETTSRTKSPSRSSHHALLATVSTLALFACDSDTTQTADAVVEDSAGVRIVQHTGPGDGEPPFAFAPEPIYRHGDDPGDYTFARIWRGILLGDGSAAIFDAGSSEVVRLNPDGTFRSVLAPAGEGPGEVSRLVTSMFAVGRDSIVVLDRAQTRSTLFVNGTPAHMASILDLRRATSLWPMGFDDAGRFLVATTSFLPGFEEEWLFGHMARYDPEAGAVDTVASYRYVPGESNPAPGVGRVLVSGGQFVYVRTDIPEVVWHLADGTVSQIARWQLEPRYLTAEDLEAIEPILRDRLRFVNPGASDEEVEDMTRRNMAQHETDLGNLIEHFKSPFADTEGRVWLPTSMPGIPGEGVPPYTVISPEGEWLGMVDAPPGLLDVASGQGAPRLTRRLSSSKSLGWSAGYWRRMKSPRRGTAKEYLPCRFLKTIPESMRAASVLGPLPRPRLVSCHTSHVGRSSLTRASSAVNCQSPARPKSALRCGGIAQSTRR